MQFTSHRQSPEMRLQNKEIRDTKSHVKPAEVYSPQTAGC